MIAIGFSAQILSPERLGRIRAAEEEGAASPGSGTKRPVRAGVVCTSTTGGGATTYLWKVDVFREERRERFTSNVKGL